MVPAMLPRSSPLQDATITTAIFTLLLAGVMSSHARNFIGLNIGDGYSLNATESAMEAAKLNVTRLKFFRTIASEISALSSSKLMVTIINSRLFAYADEATGYAQALSYVRTNIVPFPHVYAIAVGNEPFLTGNGQYAPLVYPAMKNIRAALRANNNLHKTVQVVTPFDYGSIFRADINGRKVAGGIFKFLKSNRYPFVVNVYPHVSCRNDPKIPLSYCLGNNSGPSAPGRPANMLDAMVRTTYARLAALGYPTLSVVVGETGWPSSSSTGETSIANIGNQIIYVNTVIKYVDDGGVPVFYFQLQEGRNDFFGLFKNTTAEPKFSLPSFN